MKYLASGYQYNVYDLGNGRVLKKKRFILSTIFQMYRVYRRHGLSFSAALSKSMGFLSKSRTTTLEIKRRLGELPPTLLGNPVFSGGIDYEQDKIEIIEDYFDAHSLEENKGIIDKYLETCFKLWLHGVHDPIFKLKANYGIDAAGSVILSDFNEVTFSQKEALETVRNKDWLRARFYEKWEEGELKSYYTEKMERAMTVKSLEKLWKSL